MTKNNSDSVELDQFAKYPPRMKNLHFSLIFHHFQLTTQNLLALPECIVSLGEICLSLTRILFRIYTFNQR